MLGRIAEIAVIAFAVLIAINQVGIATDLVNILFIGIVAALALALGLAFGLGGREVAGQVTQDWYDRSKEVSARAQAQMAKASPASSSESQPTPTTRTSSPPEASASLADPGCKRKRARCWTVWRRAARFNWRHPGRRQLHPFRQGTRAEPGTRRTPR